MNTKDRLEIEHKSWAVSTLCLAVFAFFGWSVWNSQRIEGYFLVAIPVILMWALSETCRIVLDRKSGTVSIYRKTMRVTDWTDIPLDTFLGAFVETLRGRTTAFRLNLGFEDDGKTWFVPARLMFFYTPWTANALCEDINTWQGVTTSEVKRRFPDPKRRLI